MWEYTKKIEVIDDFRVYPYTCFSNFSNHIVILPMSLFDNREITFKTGEHAFQAFKCDNRADAEWVISAPTPADAKRRASRNGVDGRKITLRAGWDSISKDVMNAVVYAKTLLHFTIREVLVNTGNDIIIEGNTWGDKLWGMVKNKDGVWEGENRLGQAWMNARWRIAWEEYTKVIPYYNRG